MTKRITAKRAELLLVGFAIAITAALPFYTHTSTYPITIVQGNSMYPTLQNGDLVIFRSQSQPIIANNSIIVFVEGATGVSGLDSLIRPVVIHRVVGVVVQADGMVNYRTKGDNNQFVDPSLAQADHVLGVPMQVIPKAGLAVLFVQSPQGMVAVIGMISLLYLGGVDARAKTEKKKEAFLAELARMALNGEISEAAFKKFELAVKYANDIGLEGISDGTVVALVDWFKRGGPDMGWRLGKTVCPACSGTSLTFEGGKNQLLLLCTRCADDRSGHSPPTQ